MSLNPTDEQSAIIHWQGEKLVVNAFAGTGKTSTLVQFAAACPESRMLYLAYNRAIRDEAERRFPLMWSAKPPISWRIRGSESISGIVWCRGCQ